VRRSLEIADARRQAFGTRVRELRTAAGLSQEQLGHVAGLDRTYIGSVERGERNISLDNIWRLSDALNVHPCAFMSSHDG
jgi:transcriptional regulator with XRE-family HTH domain